MTPLPDDVVAALRTIAGHEGTDTPYDFGHARHYAREALRHEETRRAEAGVAMARGSERSGYGEWEP